MSERSESIRHEGEEPVVPVLVELDSGGTTVRGHVWQGDTNWVILLHGPGEDLDAWGDVPATIATDGYSVLAIDLPGHGLSDGVWSPDEDETLIESLTRFAQTSGATRVFVVAPGALAESATRSSAGIAAAVALSPMPQRAIPGDRTPPTLILVGGSENEAVKNANRFFRQLRGWAVLSSLGTHQQGTALFASEWRQHALEQFLAFLRDYRQAPGPHPPHVRASAASRRLL